MTETHNALAHASSAYLRSAMHQPVQWHSWGEEAFALAAQQDKPVLLDIGAVWCHWCHVMDRESYEDATLAALINEHYIAIKVDRDERPDVDSRYQAAVQALTSQGGWPLTAILTPDGRPFFGGTYFPRNDAYGRPGFDRVLRTLADVWKNRRNEAAVTLSVPQIWFLLRKLGLRLKKSRSTPASERVKPTFGGVRSSLPKSAPSRRRS